MNANIIKIQISQFMKFVLKDHKSFVIEILYYYEIYLFTLTFLTYIITLFAIQK